MGSCREDCAARLRLLSKQIRASLWRDRKQQAAQVALEAEQYLEDGDVHEAQGWYRDRGRLQFKPTFLDLQELSDEYEALYAHRPVVGRSLLVEVQPYAIPDDVPDEKEIVPALHHLRRRRAAGPSQMRAEFILRWEEKNPAAWSLFIDLVHQSFLGFESIL